MSQFVTQLGLCHNKFKVTFSLFVTITRKVSQMPPRKPRETVPNTDKPLAERNVSMSNAIARAVHNLSLPEKRIIACGLACTDSKSARAYNLAVMNGGWIIRLVAMEYAETMGIDPRTAYEQLKTVAGTLIKKQWVITEGKKVTRFNWLSRMTYHEGEGWVELEFTHHTAPHLLALRSEFTTYKLKQAAALRSVYSWRLLECFKSWNGTGHWKPSVEEFCNAMEAKASHRSNFGMLRRSVIEPAVKELREKDGMEIEWTPIKAGRKVTGLSFKFRPDPQGRLNLENS